MLLRETKQLPKMILLLAIQNTRISLHIINLPEQDLLLEIPLSLGIILWMKIESVYVATRTGIFGGPVSEEVGDVHEEVVCRSFGAGCADCGEGEEVGPSSVGGYPDAGESSGRRTDSRFFLPAKDRPHRSQHCGSRNMMDEGYLMGVGC